MKSPARNTRAPLLKLLMCGLLWIMATQSADANSSAYKTCIIDGDKTCIVYENPGRTSRIIITKTTWTIGPIIAEKPLPSEDGFLAEYIGRPIIDCSDPTYRCMQSWGYTIAIPRSGFKPRLKYEKEGFLFEVENCLRGDTKRCQVAVVSAKCEISLVDSDACIHSRSARKGKPVQFDYIIYFITAVPTLRPDSIVIS